MNKKYLTLGVIAVIIGGVFLKRCDNKKKGEITDEQLKPTERTAIIIDSNSGKITTITRRNKGTTGLRPPLLRGRKSEPGDVSTNIVKRIDGAKNVRISIDNEGNLSYTARIWGWQFQPEIGVYGSSGNTGITLSDSFFFYKGHATLLGLKFALAGGKQIRPYLGYEYNPNIKYFNDTSAMIGIDLDKQLVIGITVSF